MGEIKNVANDPFLGQPEPDSKIGDNPNLGQPGPGGESVTDLHTHTTEPDGKIVDDPYIGPPGPDGESVNDLHTHTPEPNSQLVDDPHLGPPGPDGETVNDLSTPTPELDNKILDEAFPDHPLLEGVIIDGHYYVLSESEDSSIDECYPRTPEPDEKMVNDSNIVDDAFPDPPGPDGETVNDLSTHTPESDSKKVDDPHLGPPGPDGETVNDLSTYTPEPDSKIVDDPHLGPPGPDGETVNDLFTHTPELDNKILDEAFPDHPLLEGVIIDGHYYVLSESEDSSIVECYPRTPEPDEKIVNDSNIVDDAFPDPPGPDGELFDDLCEFPLDEMSIDECYPGTPEPNDDIVCDNLSNSPPPNDVIVDGTYPFLSEATQDIVGFHYPPHTDEEVQKIRTLVYEVLDRIPNMPSLGDLFLKWSELPTEVIPRIEELLEARGQKYLFLVLKIALDTWSRLQDTQGAPGFNPVYLGPLSEDIEFQLGSLIEAADTAIDIVTSIETFGPASHEIFFERMESIDTARAIVTSMEDFERDTNSYKPGPDEVFSDPSPVLSDDDAYRGNVPSEEEKPALHRTDDLHKDPMTFRGKKLERSPGVENFRLELDDVPCAALSDEQDHSVGSSANWENTVLPSGDPYMNMEDFIETELALRERVNEEFEQGSDDMGPDAIDLFSYVRVILSDDEDLDPVPTNTALPEVVYPESGLTIKPKSEDSKLEQLPDDEDLGLGSTDIRSDSDNLLTESHRKASKGEVKKNSMPSGKMEPKELQTDDTPNETEPKGNESGGSGEPLGSTDIC